MVSREEILGRLVEKEEDKERAKIKKQRFAVYENIKKVKEDQLRILIPLREEIVAAEKKAKQKYQELQNAQNKVNGLRSKLVAESTRLTHTIQEGKIFLRSTAPENLTEKIRLLRNEFDRLLTVDVSVVEPGVFEVRDMIKQVRDKIKQVEYEILNPVEEDA